MPVDPEPSPGRAVAYEVIRRTFGESAFTDVLLRELAGELDARDRAQAKRLSYGTVQRRATLDAAVDRLSSRPLRRLDEPVLAALRLGLYELLFSGDAAPYAIVNEAVVLARRAGAGKATGTVNAILRRADRERDALLAGLERESTPEEAAVWHSVPEWLARMWWEELGREQALAVMRASNQPAERCLRVNALRWSPAEALAAAKESGEAVSPAGEGDQLVPDALLRVEGSWAAIEEWIPGGLGTPQSRGSAAAVEVLGPQPGEQVLEIGAGPGTKSGQIAERMLNRGELIAVEPEEQRAGEVADQLRRLGATCASVVEADARGLQLGAGFQRVLVDAPCSDLGALASRPDARWRKSPRTIERLAQLQAELLEAAAAQLAPGGTLVYSTCTVSARENEERAVALLGSADGSGPVPRLEADDLGALHPRLASARDRRFLQLLPGRDGATGFFIARFRRA